MSHIPTDSDIATKSDVDTLGDRLDLRIDRLDTRMGGFEDRMDRFEAHMIRFDDKLDGFHAALREQTRTYMFTMTGVMAAFATIVVASGILN